MATQDEWSAMLTGSIAWQVRLRRKAKGWSAQHLSVMCSAFGYDIPRSVIADLENGRRHSISVMELIVFARVLDVSPIDLVYPLELTNERFTAAPVEPGEILDARDWWRGSKPDPGSAKEAERAAVEMSAVAVAVSTLHDLLAKQQDEFNRKLAEQQKLIDTLAARAHRESRQDRGAQQLQMIQALAAMRTTGVQLPPEAMSLLKQELPDSGLLPEFENKITCANGHDVTVGQRFCLECGISMTAGEDLRRLHVATLRKLCRERGLPDSGTKEDIVARLNAKAFCVNGHEVPPGSRSCPECGTGVARTPPPAP